MIVGRRCGGGARQRTELLREREDDVEVRHGDNFPTKGLEPALGEPRSPTQGQ